jgi:phage-related minor tail protein
MSGITREFLVLGHELSQGQYKRFGGSLLVLAEYSTTAKNALSVLVGPLGGVAAAIGVLGLIAASGAHEQHKFNMMLIETGNAAGLTAARLEQVAAAAAKNSRATIGAGVESAMAVAGTGRFGPETFAAATEAALLFQRVTGKTAEEVVTDLAKMRDGVAQWAAEHNKSMHFMSAGQYEAVRRMEEAGHAEEAQRAVLEALNAKLSESTRNLGFFARAWDDVKASVSDVAHAIANWGKSATIDTEVARITSRLEIAEVPGGLGKLGVQRFKHSALRFFGVAGFLHAAHGFVLAGRHEVHRLVVLGRPLRHAVAHLGEIGHHFLGRLAGDALE